MSQGVGPSLDTKLIHEVQFVRARWTIEHQEVTAIVQLSELSTHSNRLLPLHRPFPPARH